jgi:serine/threonine protein kinase
MGPEGEESEPLSPPKAISSLSIHGHDVVEEIARGGMGIVYRARQLDPNRIVALKMLLPQRSASAEMRERFRLETRVIASLEHAAILPVYTVGEYHGMPYFTMKFAAGGTLSARRDQYRGEFRRIAELMIRSPARSSLPTNVACCIAT